MRGKKNFVVVMATVTILLGLFSVINAQRLKQESELIDVPAPNFSLVTLDGEKVTLEQFKGKVVILNFWGTWCPPCRKEIPDFIRMYDKHRKDGLEIIGITLSSGSAADIKKFVEKNSINYLVLTGDEKYLQHLTEQYGGIRGIPTTFLIDREGIIREKWVGARAEEIFMESVKEYL
jgi:cytochrome c biogenesis protein CcmG/thiol:disulfide interchange protein DsbE